VKSEYAPSQLPHGARRSSSNSRGSRQSRTPQPPPAAPPAPVSPRPSYSRGTSSQQLERQFHSPCLRLPDQLSHAFPQQFQPRPPVFRPDGFIRPVHHRHLRSQRRCRPNPRHCVSHRPPSRLVLEYRNVFLFPEIQVHRAALQPAPSYRLPSPLDHLRVSVIETPSKNATSTRCIPAARTIARFSGVGPYLLAIVVRRISFPLQPPECPSGICSVLILPSTFPLQPRLACPRCSPCEPPTLNCACFHACFWRLPRETAPNLFFPDISLDSASCFDISLPFVSG